MKVELIEWLLSWLFVTMREEGCQLANSLLNEAYLEPVGGLSSMISNMLTSRMFNPF